MTGQELRLIMALIFALGLSVGIDTISLASASEVSNSQSELQHVIVGTDRHAYYGGEIAIISGKVSSDILGSSEGIAVLGKKAFRRCISTSLRN